MKEDCYQQLAIGAFYQRNCRQCVLKERFVDECRKKCAESTDYRACYKTECDVDATPGDPAGGGPIGGGPDDPSGLGDDDKKDGCEGLTCAPGTCKEGYIYTYRGGMMGCFPDLWAEKSSLQKQKENKESENENNIISAIDLYTDKKYGCRLYSNTVNIYWCDECKPHIQRKKGDCKYVCNRVKSLYYLYKGGANKYKDIDITFTTKHGKTRCPDYTIMFDD